MIFIKKFFCIIICLFLCLQLSSCLPIIKRFIGSTEESSVDVSADLIVTPVVLDPMMIYERAARKLNNANAYVRTEEFETVTKKGDSSKTFYNKFISKQKFTGTSNEEFSLTVANDPDSIFTLSYCARKGYFDNGRNTISFDCTTKQFYDFVNNYWLVDGVILNWDAITLLSTEATCTSDSEGNYILTAQKVIYDELVKRDMLQASYQYYPYMGALNIDISVVISQQYHFKEILIKASFTSDVGGGEQLFEIKNTLTYEDLNNKALEVSFPENVRTHVGSADVLKVFSSVDKLDTLKGYSSVLKEEHIASGPQVDYHDIYEDEFVISNVEDQVYAQKITYKLLKEDAEHVYFYYFENGTEYLRYNNETSYFNYGDDYEYSYSGYIWLEPRFGLDIGYDFVHMENENGTATFTFKYDKEDIKRIINDYLYTFYGEDSVGAYDSIMNVRKADACVTYDLKTGVLLEHSYEIDIDVYYDFKTISYRETRTVIVDADDYSVPSRDQFFGTSDL